MASISGNQEYMIEQWLNELSSDEDEIGSNLRPLRGNTHSDNDFSDSDEEFIITSDHESNSELSDSDGEDTHQDGADMVEEVSSSGYLYGKNRFKWAKVPPARNARVRSHNIIRLPYTTSRSRPVDPFDPKEAFDKIFDADIKNKILTWTNVKLAAFRLKYKSPNRAELKECTPQELDAFLGLLLYSAVFKSNHEAVISLFATDGTGREIFRLCMSSLRFYTLLLCLRFDNPDDRNERKKNRSRLHCDRNYKHF